MSFAVFMFLLLATIAVITSWYRRGGDPVSLYSPADRAAIAALRVRGAGH